MNEVKKCYLPSKAKSAPPCVLVIFGAGGDLTKRLLIPTICHLGGDGLLSDNFHVVGVGGHNLDNESFRDYVLQDIKDKVHNERSSQYGQTLCSRVHFVKGRFENGDTFTTLKERLDELAAKEGASKNYIFYLATPASTFLPVIQSLYEVGLLDQSEGFRRVIIEKPFGHDLNSAIELNKSILVKLAKIKFIESIIT